MNDYQSRMRDLRNIYLRKLIGGRARYHDEIYEIIEVLEDGPALVLQNYDHKTIQADQHGEAHRRVPETVTLTLPLTGDGAVDLAALDIELLDVSVEDTDPVTT